MWGIADENRLRGELTMTAYPPPPEYPREREWEQVRPTGHLGKTLEKLREKDTDPGKEDSFMAASLPGNGEKLLDLRGQRWALTTGNLANVIF